MRGDGVMFMLSPSPAPRCLECEDSGWMWVYSSEIGRDQVPCDKCPMEVSA
jgi:hypothetical protein